QRIDTIVLDKTGTVTEGRMALAAVVAADGESDAEVLHIAGAVESGSEHPIARAIVAAADSAGPLPAVTDFQNVEGLGAQGIVDGRAVVIGRPQLLEQWSVGLTPELRTAFDEAQSAGATVVAIAWDGAP